MVSLVSIAGTVWQPVLQSSPPRSACPGNWFKVHHGKQPRSSAQHAHSRNVFSRPVQSV